MKPFILTVTLNPAIDKTITVPSFQTGKTFREETLSLSAGGKGLNVSRVLKTFGIQTVASGFLGKYNNMSFKKNLDREGIHYEFTPINGEIRTSLTVIDPVSDKITRVLERGPHVSRKEINAFFKKYLSLLQKSFCVVFSGRNIPGAPDTFYAKLIREARKRDVLTFLDTSGKALTLGLEQRPFMIKPNKTETEFILGEKLSSWRKLKKGISRLHEYGTSLVAVTLAEQGAFLSDSKHILYATAPDIKRKSPVGCGDSFIAGFLVSFMKKKSLGECLRMGVACGTANALSRNPGFLKKKNVFCLLRQIRVKSL